MKNRWFWFSKIQWTKRRNIILNKKSHKLRKCGERQSRFGSFREGKILRHFFSRFVVYTSILYFRTKMYYLWRLSLELYIIFHGLLIYFKVFHASNRSLVISRLRSLLFSHAINGFNILEDNCQSWTPKVLTKPCLGLRCTFSTLFAQKKVRDFRKAHYANWLEMWGYSSKWKPA